MSSINHRFLKKNGAYEIAKQWLKPASYDEKAKREMLGDTEVIYDVNAPEFQAQNFKAQNLVKKNTKKPLMEEPVVGQPSLPRANELYEEESLSLLEEIMDILESEEDLDYVYWRGIAEHLREVRDTLFSSLSEDVEILGESTLFKAGKLKLADGKSVNVSNEEARIMNQIVSGTKDRNAMFKDATHSLSDYKEFLKFARDINEDFDGTILSILNEVSIEDLQFIDEQDLSEGEVWNHIKAGAKVGTKSGAKIGQVAGAAAGGAYGATVGGGVAIGKKVKRAVGAFKRKRKNYVSEADDKSVLGTAAPALDSDVKRSVNRHKGIDRTVKKLKGEDNE